MIFVSLSNVSLTLAGRPIFRNLTWEVQDSQRVGLVGPNGAGKSSLLKLIVGEFTPDPGGAVARARGVTVGYLAQDPELDPAQTVLAAAQSGNQRLLEVGRELDLLEASLSDPRVQDDSARLGRALEKQQRLLHEYSALDGAAYPARVRRVLQGLGLAEGDYERPLGTLSGGQKKLAGLARLLLAQPSVLLLDEPDNHLDLAGKAFLEDMIQDYPGAVVLVSHDRYLLDRVVTHVTEIEDGKLSTFAGDYTAYVVDKQARLARQQELYQVQKAEIRRLEAAARRYAAWVVQNDKFASRLRAVRARIERIEKIDRPVLERRTMDLRLNGWRGSNKVLEVTGLNKRFGSLEVLGGVELLLRHGERVGLIGANGAGKSVLLRIILGEVAADSGEVKIGPSVKQGYYAQEHETLDYGQTLLEAVRRARPLSQESAVAFLGRYLFPYSQSTQNIGQLSGGERSRLQLALLVLSGANFLLLDEPTNNLDIASAEVLEGALADFEGTVLVISHDRYFLDGTVNRIVELENGRLTEYIGSYTDYAEKKAAAD